MSPTNKRCSRMGFAVEAEIKSSVTPEMEDSFLTEIFDPRSFSFGGWNSDGLITRPGRGSVI